MRPEAAEVLPYEVAVTDAVSTSLDEFRTKVIDTLDDPRGWELGGTIDLQQRRSAAVSGAVTSGIGR